MWGVSNFEDMNCEEGTAFNMHEVVMYRACVLNDKTQQGQRIHYSLLSDLSKLPLRLLRVPVKTLPMQSMHGLRPLQDALDHIAKEIEKAMGS